MIFLRRVSEAGAGAGAVPLFERMVFPSPFKNIHPRRYSMSRPI